MLFNGKSEEEMNPISGLTTGSVRLEASIQGKQHPSPDLRLDFEDSLHHICMRVRNSNCLVVKKNRRSTSKSHFCPSRKISGRTAWAKQWESRVRAITRDGGKGG
jgi:hypothetical protein